MPELAPTEQEIECFLAVPCNLDMTGRVELA
jgi:hypothetical protein